jgi:hypothetical protein
MGVKQGFRAIHSTTVHSTTYYLAIHGTIFLAEIVIMALMGWIMSPDTQGQLTGGDDATGNMPGFVFLLVRSIVQIILTNTRQRLSSRGLTVRPLLDYGLSTHTTLQCSERASKPSSFYQPIWSLASSSVRYKLSPPHIFTLGSS